MVSHAMKMHRKALNELLKWKENLPPRRKPLLLLGARQVGKTWLMREFGAQAFERVAYIRFDRNATMRRVFEEDGADMTLLLSHLQAEVGFRVEAGSTLLILDEIQECPAALTALKYFCEDVPELHVMAAGSLLGVRQHEGTGFPVGKVNTKMLYPMSYTEFLRAVGQGVLAEMLEAGDWSGVAPFHDRLAELLRLYYFVGGMPEAVARYAETGDFSLVREVQQELVFNYEQDFSKHAPKNVAAKIAQIWDSVPTQLAKENKRFLYGDVKKGWRAKDLEDAMDWLLRAGLIYHCHRITKPALPVDSYRDGAFKVFFSDVGLLGAKAGLDASVLIQGNRIFQEFKGALAEQYVQQQLRAESGISPSYWLSESSRTELDFLFQSAMAVVPVEVKAEQNTQAKSLKSYCAKFTPPVAVRTSMRPYYSQGMPLPDGGSTQLIDLPLYAVCRMAAECAATQAASL